MDKEVIKAMNRKPSKIKKWWSKNNYKVWRVLLFPLWIFSVLAHEIDLKLNTNTPWDKNRAHEILNYYIPRTAQWDEETKTFDFFDNGLGWGSKYTIRKIKLKDRRFWKIYSSWNGGLIRDYLINTFELEGFTKEINDIYDTCTDISFIME